MPTSTGQPPQPMPAPANPSRPSVRKMSTGSALRLPTYGSRTGQSPMSFGAAMSGVSFGNANGGGSGFSYGKSFVPGSYGANFYGDIDSPHLFDSSHMPFGQSINMDGSFIASSAAFGLMGGSSYRGRSYAAAAGGRELYSPANLSASLASLTTNPMGSLGHSYSRGHLETIMNRRSEAEYTKEYDCCGVKHSGLHALLEHVEDQHPYSDPHMVDAGFSPVTLAMDLDLEVDPESVPSTTNSARSSTSPRPVPNYPLTPTSATGPRPDPPAVGADTTNSTTGSASSIAPLQLSDVLKSPPGGEASSLPGANGAHVVDLSSGVPKFNHASRGAFMGGQSKTGQQRFDRAFNEVVAGKAGLEDPNKPPGPSAVAPSVLFTSAATMGHPQASTVVGRREGTAGNGAPGTAPPTPTATTSGPAAQASAATTTTTPAPAAAEVKKEGGQAEEKSDVTAAPADPPKAVGVPPPPSGAAANKALDPPLPPPSLFTTHKAWRCPNPGCNKAYKQSNGLKYHLQKGQCDFAIHDAIDHGLTLEEAEERARPYVCAVGAGCTKRYRQMNGLKYHYLNSGEHGQYGLRMLQNGTHPHPPSHPPVPKRDRTQHRNNGEINPNARPAPYAIPQRPAGTNPAAPAAVPTTIPTATAPRMGTWPAAPAPRVGVPQTNGVAPTAPRAAVPAATVTTTTSATKAPTPAAVPTKMPVQRGRDAVLFANVDALDV